MTETHGRMTIVAAPGAPAGTFTIGGSIDETADLHQLPGRAAAGRLALDLAGVAFINSLGVRDWIRMQAVAQASGLVVELHRVSEPLVHQLNMIVATRGNATVTSFYAPYACDACGREETVLIDAIAHHDRLMRLDPPLFPCAECGASMAFNDFPERYFSFLAP